MKSSTLLLIIITLILVGGGYWHVSVSGGEQPPLTSSVPREGAQTQFQVLVGKLQKLTFNTEIFSDPRFSSFIDLTTTVTEESLGRTDPFASISGAADTR